MLVVARVKPHGSISISHFPLNAKQSGYREEAVSQTQICPEKNKLDKDSKRVERTHKISEFKLI